MIEKKSLSVFVIISFMGKELLKETEKTFFSNSFKKYKKKTNEEI
jgi:hypothetical protein